MPLYTLEIDDDFNKTIAKAADRKGVSKGEYIKRALAVYLYLQDHVNAGFKVAVLTKGDEITKEVTLP
jgi:hypothetical protein